MTSRDRVIAALRGGEVDRPPVSFWGHVYHRESSAQELVEHTLERWRRHRWDWIKLNPRKHYHVEPWGVRYRYSGVPDEKPELESFPVRVPADWSRIREVPHDEGALGEQLEAVRLLRAALPAEIPILATVFTPLAILGELTEPPTVLREHLASAPGQVEAALENVTRVFERLAAAYVRAGADGIFLATVDWGCREFVSPADLRRWSRPFDLRVLAAAGASPFHTLHVCKDHNLLFEFADYPVGAFSWDVHLPGNPTLAEGLARLPGAVMGGIAHEDALQQATPDAALAQYRRALEETGGRRWLVAPGCSIPLTTPEANLAAIRDEVARTPAPPGRIAR
ncbi:MAG TPA: uroporphyrinogen decarboxylase family protein [Candidatus Acidoferrales bacterium]|nr:uroporphyrinogen decarboxylase family protein [Candidatus Acidoferrales bacterium]